MAINDQITVTDTNGNQWTFTDTGSQYYDQTFIQPGTFTNTATVTETGQFASATIEVTQAPFCQTSWDAIAYWCFDDQANPTVDGADGHDATVVGAAFETLDIPAVVNNVAAIRFDGVDDYAWTTDPGGTDNLDGFTGLTVAAWINPDGLQGSSFCCGMIASKYHSGPPFADISWWFTVRGDEVEIAVETDFASNTFDSLTSSGVDLVAGEWVHVAGTWDGALFHLFVNGTEVATKTTTLSVMDENSVQVDIGAAEAFANGQRSALFDGGIDEVYIFDRAASAAEIAELAAESQ